ncbi:hypothetical protein BS50DRAFT_626911 [Corynespora cassiicola Philippines]|uniref:MADS-box domain-containing protein n=1 Tax=Corynespora cassiicola Philippines TaxID=1448308 RepID=A0A2T2N0U6_CORCC|nr:hypothetical protein BS50DRAFT_626911 [Corynespora cassiicola Philippines]
MDPPNHGQPSLHPCSPPPSCTTPAMSSHLLPQTIGHPKAKRAANNNYQKLSKTLYEKLAKLNKEYGAEIYFIAYRNGRFHGFVSTNGAGQRWSPPGQDILVSISAAYPPESNPY